MVDIRGRMDSGRVDAEERFRALFDETFRPLLGYVLRRVASREDAADVVADTFGGGGGGTDDVPAGEEARLWLFGVARRVLSNQARGNVRRSRLADRLRAELADVDLDGPPAY